MLPKFYFKDIQKNQNPTEYDEPQSTLRIDAPTSAYQGVALHPDAQGILLPSFVMLILGKPGSGKSHLISQLINKECFYGKRFDRIIYIGNTKFKDVIHDSYNTNPQCDEKFIKQKIKQAQLWAENMLIVFDDVISSIPSGSKQNFFQQLFFNRRHLMKSGTISIIITSQKFTSVPTWIRTTINSLFSFPISKIQAKTLFNELAPITNWEKLMHLYGNLKKHQFIFYNLEVGKIFDYIFRIL